MTNKKYAKKIKNKNKFSPLKKEKAETKLEPAIRMPYVSWINAESIRIRNYTISSLSNIILP